RRAEGGIKAQTKSGGVGTSWWGERWIAGGERFDIGAPLGRGRSSAPNRQGLSVDGEAGGGGGEGGGGGAATWAAEERAGQRRDDQRGRAVEEGLVPGGARAVVAGAVRGEAARRRDAAGHRGGLHRRVAVAVSAGAGRFADGVLVSGLLEPVQAHRGGVLLAGRGVRPRPVPAVPAARPGARRAVEATDRCRCARAGNCAGDARTGGGGGAAAARRGGVLGLGRGAGGRVRRCEVCGDGSGAAAAAG